MTPDQLNEQKLEYTCVSIICFLQELLKQGDINAIEFLSMTEQLPVKPTQMKYYAL